MIFKKRLQNRFTAISNEICVNTSLSTDARWCLWYLLTKPEDWEVRVNDIRQVSGWGRDKVKSAINELVNARYVIKRQERADGGQFDINAYDVYEFPVADYPLTENPLTVDPVTENTSLNKDLKKPNTDKTPNTEKDIYLDGFEEFWQAYPKRSPHPNPKHPAKLKYVNARKVHNVSHETLMTAARAYADAVKGKNPEHIAQAVTWLNQRRWEDYNPDEKGVKAESGLSDEALVLVLQNYPGVASNREEAKRLLASEVNKGVMLEEITEAAHKLKLLVKQAHSEGREMPVSIFETWIKFKWREMDAYEFYRGGMTMKLFVRPKKVK